MRLSIAPPLRHLPGIHLHTSYTDCIKLAIGLSPSILSGHKGLFLLNPLSDEEGKLRVYKLEDICSNPSGQLLFHPRIYDNQLIFLFSYSYKKLLITNNPAVLSSIILWFYSSQPCYFLTYYTVIFRFNILLPAIQY